MLTIKRLAEYVGVTVRAVRHYHQTGLLPEPERDASGYRRYPAQAVVDLIRIRTLTAAGVPLTRVHELIRATPEQFAAAVEEIGQGLTRQIEELEHRKAGVAALRAGDRMFLPAEITDYLDQLRALGVSERGVSFERDGWIVLAAAYPDQALTWIAQKRDQLADPGFRQFYVTYDQAHDWDPADPRLQDLADVMAARLRQEAAQTVHEVLSADEKSLLGAHVQDFSPAWLRLAELVRQRTTS
ncbi:MerR family transcriptional regulator [Lentzea sp. BCCO 10_0061]|uniref:MerR family transcriptional regulator n=1 Tax=Lentzea sokolovensis TaxID=3095429 RepID=A0ABU4V4B5_9PSEU|nr:MerR family transcriptional regulator [Lentzea sp. BCCO 10_0061]MDX8145818.1 MerR family transcriptional regulator [Lentzea sp. BCCO 10_0061]